MRIRHLIQQRVGLIRIEPLRFTRLFGRFEIVDLLDFADVVGFFGLGLLFHFLLGLFLGHLCLTLVFALLLCIAVFLARFLASSLSVLRVKAHFLHFRLVAVVVHFCDVGIGFWRESVLDVGVAGGVFELYGEREDLALDVGL